MEELPAPRFLCLLLGSGFGRGVRGLTNDLRGNNTYRPTRGTSDGPCVVRAGVWDACGELGRLVSRHRGVLLRGRCRAVRGRCLAGPVGLRWVGSPSGWQWSRSAGPWVSVQGVPHVDREGPTLPARGRSARSHRMLGGKRRGWVVVLTVGGGRRLLSACGGGGVGIALQWRAGRCGGGYARSLPLGG